ncbi:MAG TPA: type VI secretion system baseplate subunit TssG, partial [Steroidobacteraceae bacterium]|nr:type VI secretion system baseplate subunit TssG [Steroidobacteraceae bacterium]
MRSRTALALLGSAPQRFRFDAAVRVLTRARRTRDPAEAAMFRSPPGLVYPPADVLEVRQQGGAPPEVTVGLMGLTGPSGVMPRYYTEVLTQTLRSRSAAMRDFFDMLSRRFVAFFAG